MLFYNYNRYPICSSISFRTPRRTIKQKERIYAVPVLLHEEQLNKDEIHYQTLNNIYGQIKFQGDSIGLLVYTAPRSLNIQSHINSLSQCFHHSKQARCSLRASIA